MKVKTKDNNALLWIFCLCSMILEVINFNRLHLGFLPENILYDVAFLFIIVSILYMVKTKIVKMIVLSVLLFFQAFLNIVNQILIENTSVVFYFKILSQAKEGADAFDFAMIDKKYLLLNLCIVLVFYVISLLFVITKKKATLKTNQRNIVPLLITAICMQVVGLCAGVGAAIQTKVTRPEVYSYVDEELISSLNLKNYEMKHRGFWGYYFSELMLLSSEEDSNTNFDPKLMTSTEITNSTAMSGASKDDNLIVIMLESFDSYAIDPYNTPNLWKLATDGINFTNFYGTNFTNDSEYIGINGHATNNITYPAENAQNPYSLARLFLNEGYDEVNYFHSWWGNVYSRTTNNKYMGFENVYCLGETTMEEKPTKWLDWCLDSDYVENMMELMIPENKSFFSFYTTISAHGGYDYSNPRFEEFYGTYDTHLQSFKAWLKQEGFVYPQTAEDEHRLKEYKAGAMDMDKAVGLMIAELERQNILNKTTIVLYGDHNAYGNNLTNTIKNIDIWDTSNIKLHNIPFIIYNTKIAAAENSNFCSTYDIYPTICDLFGFKYSSMLAQGYSVFDDDISKTLFVSFKTGIFNSDYYTEDLITIKNLKTVSNETKLKFFESLNEFLKKQQYVNGVYKTGVLKQSLK